MARVKRSVKNKQLSVPLKIPSFVRQEPSCCVISLRLAWCFAPIDFFQHFLNRCFPKIQLGHPMVNPRHEDRFPKQITLEISIVCPIPRHDFVECLLKSGPSPLAPRKCDFDLTAHPL